MAICIEDGPFKVSAAHVSVLENVTTNTTKPMQLCTNVP